MKVIRAHCNKFRYKEDVKKKLAPKAGTVNIIYFKNSTQVVRVL